MPRDRHARRGRADVRPARPRRAHFRRALTLLALTLVAPGSAQVVAGHRGIGRFAVRVWLGILGLVAIVGLVALVAPRLLISLAAVDLVLTVLRVVLLVAAAGWLALFVDAWRLGRPLDLHQRQRLTATVLTGVLAFVTSGALVLSSQYVAAAHGSLTAIFQGTEKVDPFAGRYNVLVLGADSAAGRDGLRPDSITVASIDEETGATALFSLPRNLQNVPFAPGSVMAKRFPDGYDCGSECLLNAVYTWGTENADLFPEGVDPGLAAMTSAVEGITGLPMSYRVIVSMDGFVDLVDALGGLRLEVQERLPIGGGGTPVHGYIEPGTQVLDGYHALWFARSRADSSDYARMARQRCVLAAMLDQLDPTTVATKFTSLAAAGERLLWTDIPASELDTFVDLTWKAKRRSISSVQFVPPLITTADPDYELIRRLVRKAVEDAKTPGVETAEKATQARAVPGFAAAGSTEGSGDGDPSDSDRGERRPESVRELDAACAAD